MPCPTQRSRNAFAFASVSTALSSLSKSSRSLVIRSDICQLVKLKDPRLQRVLRESWVGDSRILPELKSGGGFARFQSLLGRTHEFGESLRLIDSQVGQNLAIEIDPGHFQTVHELTVI